MAIKRLAIYPRFLANSVGSITSQIRERAKTIVSTAIDSAAARPITKEFLFMAFSFSKVLYAQLVNLPPYVPICPRGAFWPIAIGAPPPVYTSTFDPATARREKDLPAPQVARAHQSLLRLRPTRMSPLRPHYATGRDLGTKARPHLDKALARNPPHAHGCPPGAKAPG